MFRFRKADGGHGRLRVNLSRWTLDPGNVAATAGLERHVGSRRPSSSQLLRAGQRAESGPWRFSCAVSKRSAVQARLSGHRFA
jgi:hypothetical protein